MVKAININNNTAVWICVVNCTKYFIKSICLFRTTGFQVYGIEMSITMKDYNSAHLDKRPAAAFDDERVSQQSAEAAEKRDTVPPLTAAM